MPTPTLAISNLLNQFNNDSELRPEQVETLRPENCVFSKLWSWYLNCSSSVRWGVFQDEVFENVKFLEDNWPSQKNTEKAEFIAIFD